jgi:glutamate racemase
MENKSINNLNIGIFDSGIGGKTVLNEAQKLLPNEQFIYFADTRHTPYGTKTVEQVREFVFSAIDELVKKDIKALVIACNTATSIAIEDLRKRYSFPIVGMEPAVKPAINCSNGKRTLVLATPITVAEPKLQDLIKDLHSEDKVDLLALPKLVELAEKDIFSGAQVEEYLQMEFSKLDVKQYGSVVLGCTHFVYYKDIIQKFFQNADVVDGNKGTVERLKSVLQENGSLR